MEESHTAAREATSTATLAPRHSTVVRITHWVASVCILALIVSGFEIVVSHPRFYWGEDGNPMTPSLFDIPIPASRPWVQTGYNFVLPDQNGWSRNLHFEAAWIILFTGLLYGIAGLRSAHFRKNLLPSKAALAWPALSASIAKNLRFERPDESDAATYNTLQRLAYTGVIFVLVPVAIWTGLAMSPAMLSVFPFLATACGGLQSARTIHFFVSLSLVLFLVTHIVMVVRAGFKARMRPMLTGSPAIGKEQS